MVLGGGNINNIEFNRHFISDLSIVKVVLIDSLTFIKESIPYVSEDIQSEFKLIFSELLCNAIIHGNKNDKNKKVSFSLLITKNEISCVISDEGSGFNYLQLLSNNNAKDSLFLEHGRGLRLVDKLCDSLEFNEKGNIIKLIKKVNANG